MKLTFGKTGAYKNHFGAYRITHMPGQGDIYGLLLFKFFIALTIPHRIR